MSAPDPCHDAASDVVDVFITALRQGFAPASECPPLGAGSTQVFFLVGDEDRPAWNPDCDHAFLWVRVAKRYRARIGEFPKAYLGDLDCSKTDVKRVLAVEVGVMRCAVVEEHPNWETLTDAANISLDDSWRIERVLSAAAARLRTPERAVAIDTVAPFGPKDGVTAWAGVAHVQF
ncbi:hypothetical protein [Mycobacterium sp. SMC-11]|uniref:hypothetical protein n=1 Tax=Mycobacterium sp. SMC-11 TaxID=3385969 RepID=UPI00390C52B3